MKKLKNFNKTLNYKILSALPVMGVCLAATHQTSSAMFKNSFNFFKKLEKSSSGASSYIPKPLTSSTSKIGGSSMLSGGSKLPVQTPSGLNTKITTSTTSSGFGAKPEISPPDGPDPSSLSFQDKLGLFSSMGAQSTPLTSETRTKTTTSTDIKPTYSDLGARPKTHSSTTTKHTSSSQTDVSQVNYKDDLTKLVKEGSSKILKSLYEIHTSDGKNKTNLATEVKNLKANVISLSKHSYQDNFKKHYLDEGELKTNALIFGNSTSDYVLNEFDPKVTLFIDYIVNEGDPTKVQQKIQQLSSEFGNYIGTRANNDLRVKLLSFK